MFGVPAMFNAMAQTPGFASADLSSLRRLLCGGAPVPLSTIRTYLDRGVPFLQGYGMTETAPGALFLGAGRAAEKAGTAASPRSSPTCGWCGRTAPTPPGEKGEVVVAGPNVMLGYWNRPEATAEVMDGWFQSGDVAWSTTRATSRRRPEKDMIISGGENVYPAEVEDVLYSHPGVAECAVIGVPDERWGEVGRAIVVPRPEAAADGLDEQALLDHLDGRLARYKVPRSVIFADSLPRSGAGKVLKQRLRDAFGDTS